MATAATATSTNPPMSSPSREASDSRLVHESTLEGLLQLQTLVGLKRQHEGINAGLCAAWEPLLTFDDQNESNTFRLKHLDLGGCRLHRGLPKGAIDVFVKHFDDIESLNLGGTDLSATETVYLLKKLSNATDIKSLHVGGNGWGDAGMAHFANEWLGDIESGASRELKTLDVRYNDIGAEGARALSRALKDFIHHYGDYAGITKLYLEGNRLHDEGVVALSEVLGKPNRDCQVQELFLGANGIGKAGATALANALDTNINLVKLHIEGNAIQAEGALAFCRVLEEHDKATHGPMGLKHVYCDNNDIGKEVSQRLAKALNNDTSIGESL